MEMKLELVIVPVSDVERAKSFYADKVGFNADQDHTVKPGLRFVQLTPSGSGCSIAIGEGLTEMKPGSLKGLQMVVKDARAARELLIKNGVDASEVVDMPWGSFTYFADPDGNTWSVQQLPPRP
ncbi:MAG: glyoxalase [Ignavibacteria bacterium]|nr:glyoxalase [Ignavibacteria bacterium]